MQSLARIHITFLRIPVLVLTGLLGACGGGGGNSGPGEMTVGTFTRTTPAVVDGTDAYAFAKTNLRLQQLYHAHEIGAAGYIRSIGFRRASTQYGAVTCPAATIRLGHTRLTELTDNANDNVVTGEGAQVTVLHAGTLSIPPGGFDEYFDIALPQPFYYNGKDNLVVEVDRAEWCSADLMISKVIRSGRLFRGMNGNFSGGVYDDYLLTRFGFAGGDARIETGETATGNSYPFSSLTNGHHVQVLYPAGEIDGAGPIAGIAVINNVATTVETTYTVDVALGHTSRAALGTAFADNVDVGTPVTVATGVDFVVPAGLPAGSLIWLPLSATFDYNGTDNLVVDIKVTNTPTSTLPWRATATGVVGRRVAAALGSDAGTVSDFAYHIGLRFHGGKVGVVRTPSTNVALTDYFPFSGPTGKRQYLYRGVELGGAGLITKLACRIGQFDVEALSGADYTVVMSHTAATTLGTDLVANLPAASTVYAGALELPAKRQGDWQEIVLHTPFAYNGRDNLIVQIAGVGPGLGTGCLIDAQSAQLNAARRAFAGDADAAIGTPTNHLPDMLFDIRR